jgi:hypothetical protein
MTVASLGVELTGIPGFDRGKAALEAFAVTSKKAESAALSLSAKAEAAASKIGKVFSADTHAARFAQQIDRSAKALSGFDAIAARAARQAEHITRQMQKLSMSDLRNDDIQAFGREMDQLRAKFNPVFAAQQRFKAVTDEINHAQRVGAITAREATDALMREQAAYEAATAALNNNTTALARNGAAAVSVGAQRANAVNLMYQGQDIAMMAMLGQNPTALALQQGMQVGGIFSQMGGGRAIVQGLTSAIGMMLNPLNLATIATIGLGAAGVQAFMNMGQGADEATASLETNRDKMERLLTGYARAKGIVDAIFEAAARLPEGVVASDLGASLRDQEKAAKDLNERITRNNAALGETITFFEEIKRIGEISGGVTSDELNQAIQQIEMLRSLGVDMSSTRAELEAAATAAREFYNATEDESLRQMADDAYQLIMRLITIKDEAQAAGAALRNIPRDIQIRIAMSQEFGNAFAQLNSLYQDPRSRFDQMREQAKNAADQAMATAQSYGQAVGAAEQYERVLNSINAAEKEANAKSFARSAKEADKPRKAYEELTRGAREFIAAQELEQRAMFMTAEAAQRLRYEQQLLNQAANDNLKLTPAQTQELAGLAAQMAAVEEATRRVTELYNFGAGITTGFFSDVTNHLRDQASEWQNIGDVARSAWEGIGLAGANALQKIADKALENAAMGVWDMIFGAIMGGIGGGLGVGRGLTGPATYGGNGGLGIFGIPGMATGGTVAQAGLSWVGERGPELVNLPRGAQVIPNGPSMALAANQNSGDIIINNVINVPAGTSADTAPAIAREVTKELKRQLPDAIAQHNRNPLRRAG